MLRATIATAQDRAAPRMPASGIRTRFRPTSIARAIVLLRRLSQLRPAMSSTASTGPHAVASSIVSDKMTTTSDADCVVVAEHAHQRGREAGQDEVQRPGRRHAPQRGGLVDRVGLSSLTAGEQSRDLRRQCLLDGLDEQLPEHDEPGCGGVQRRVRRGGQGRHQHDVGPLQRGLGDPRDGPRRGVGPELTGQGAPRRGDLRSRRSALRPGRAASHPRRPGPTRRAVTRPAPAASVPPPARYVTRTASACRPSRPMLSTTTVGRMEPMPRVAASTMSLSAATGSTRASTRRMPCIVGAASAPTMWGASAGAETNRAAATTTETPRTGTAETTRVRVRSAVRPRRSGRAATSRAPCRCPGARRTRGSGTPTSPRRACRRRSGRSRA